MLSSFGRALRAVLPLFVLGATACTAGAIESSPPPDDAPADLPPSSGIAPREPTAPATPPIAKPEEPIATTGDHPEVVSVFMEDRKGGGWMCTGTLISPTEVITAAHCLDPEMFVRYVIVAPSIVGDNTFRGSSVRIFGGSYEAVENPDLGLLVLKDRVTLAAYAELADVVSRVQAGEAVQAAAIVRATEDPDSDFERTSPMLVTSTVDFGYDHGFGTPLFSKGGDSGAGLFLVENGVVTHKLIGVGRQPEPERQLDHFTRVDAELVTWRTSPGLP